MGSIRWRPSRGVYEASITIGVTPAGNPKRISASFKKELDAERWRMQQILDRDSGQLVLPATATLEQLLNRWEANHPQWAPNTVADRVGTLRRHVLPYLGERQVSKLTAGHVAELLGVLRRARDNPRENGKPQRLPAASEATIHRVVRHLRALLDYAVSIELVERNVAVGIKTVNPPPVKRVRWSIEETRDVLRVASLYGRTHVVGNYIYVALMTGLRREELRGLRWSDVNLSRRALRVEQVVTEVDGRLHYGPPKTDASRREVLFDAGTAAVFQQQLELQAGQRAAAREWVDRDLVFTNRRGGPLRYKQLRHHLGVVAAEAGVGMIRLYDTRSTHGSILAETGVNPKAISERLGHTDVGFTMRTYVRTGEGEQRAIAEAMGGLGVAPQPAATEPAKRESPGEVGAESGAVEALSGGDSSVLN